MTTKQAPLPPATNSSQRGRWWPWLLAGLLIFGSGTNIYMVIVAVNDPSFAVEKDYYKKALNWDRTMAQKATNTKLGWTVRLHVKPVLGRKSATLRLQAQLLNAKGEPVPNAHLAVEAFANARSNRRWNRELSRDGNHRYRTSLPLHRTGQWVFHFTALQGKQRFTQILRRDI